MEFLMRPTVYLIAATEMRAGVWPTETAAWDPEEGLDDADRLVEFAGRSCYQSWNNPSGRTNEQYLGNLLDQGHSSVFEHAAATFYLTGVSRSLTHELVRHRAGFGFSQLSQRYVDSSDVNFVVPPEILEQHMARKEFEFLCREALATYTRIIDRLEPVLADVEDAKERRKRARQTARAVLPNATETRIVVTANVTAWRHFLRMRANRHADREMRRLAVEIGRQLKEWAPGCWQDFCLIRETDGFDSWECRHAK